MRTLTGGNSPAHARTKYGHPSSSMAMIDQKKERRGEVEQIYDVITKNNGLLLSKQRKNQNGPNGLKIGPELEYMM